MTTDPSTARENLTPHWTDDQEIADQVRDVYRSLPPKFWDVTTWINSNYAMGTIDIADAHRLIAGVLGVVQ